MPIPIQDFVGKLVRVVQIVGLESNGPPWWPPQPADSCQSVPASAPFQIKSFDNGCGHKSCCSVTSEMTELQTFDVTEKQLM